MNATLNELKRVVINLPTSERAELTHFLLHTLDDSIDEEEIRAEWLDLAEARVAEIKAGTIVGIPAEEVMRSLLEPDA